MCRCFYCDEPFDSDVEGGIYEIEHFIDISPEVPAMAGPIELREVCRKCEDKLPEES